MIVNGFDSLLCLQKKFSRKEARVVVFGVLVIPCCLICLRLQFSLLADSLFLFPFLKSFVTLFENLTATRTTRPRRLRYFRGDRYSASYVLP
jgi:hypothetical protein